MTSAERRRLVELDRRHVWHPFTQMRDWARSEPRMIVGGHGATLVDARGREYLDANASIWTNLHGHNHPRLNAAVRRQLGKIAHSSALGLANEPASILAGRLVDAARLGRGARRGCKNPKLEKVFFSDNGSTALEVALKLAHQVVLRRGVTRRPRFLSLEGAYHGDTVGAVSLGHIDLFHGAFKELLFKSDAVMAPYCYRCPFNRSRPERRDARDYRKCNWECVGKVERVLGQRERRGDRYAGFVVEPLMQGAAGMIPQPDGWLGRVVERVRGHGALVIADEVMTGFGRTGDRLFACHREGVQPDFLCVAKGLTGGYLPMAATLTTGSVFAEFLGAYEEFKTFFHGHSYTGNQLGAAAALASLDLLESQASKAARARLERQMAERLEGLWKLPWVGDVRRVGLVAGVELVKDWGTREAFDSRDRVGMRVCEAMARMGVLTRPIGNVVVLMPPYVTRAGELDRMVGALEKAVGKVLGRGRSRCED